MATFSLWDWIVLIVMLFISAGIGIYYRFTGGKQKTTKVAIRCSFMIQSYLFRRTYLTMRLSFPYRNIFWLMVMFLYSQYLLVWWPVLCQQYHCLVYQWKFIHLVWRLYSSIFHIYLVLQSLRICIYRYFLNCKQPVHMRWFFIIPNYIIDNNLHLFYWPGNICRAEFSI